MGQKQDKMAARTGRMPATDESVDKGKKTRRMSKKGEKMAAETSGASATDESVGKGKNTRRKAQEVEETSTTEEVQEVSREDKKVDPRELHYDLFVKLHKDYLSPKSSQYKVFVCLCKAHLPPATLERCEDAMDLLSALEHADVIDVGKYGILKGMLKTAHPGALRAVERHQQQLELSTVWKTDRNPRNLSSVTDDHNANVRVVVVILRDEDPEVLIDNQEFQRRIKEAMKRQKDCQCISIDPGSYILHLKITSLEGLVSIWVQSLQLTLLRSLTEIFHEFRPDVEVFVKLEMTDEDFDMALTVLEDHLLGDPILLRSNGEAVSWFLKTIDEAISLGKFERYLQEHVQKLKREIDRRLYNTNKLELDFDEPRHGTKDSTEVENLREGNKSPIKDRKSHASAKRSRHDIGVDAICSTRQGPRGITLRSDTIPGMADDIPLAANEKHTKLVDDLSRAITEKTDVFLRFKNATSPYLTTGDIARSENTSQLLKTLEARGQLGVGEYAVLKEILSAAGVVTALKPVVKAEDEISLLIDPTRKRSNDAVMAGCIPPEAREEHVDLIIDLHGKIDERTDEFLRFKTAARPYLAPGDIARSTNILDLLELLETRDEFGVGKYTVLKDILSGAKLHAVRELVVTAEDAISKLIYPTGSRKIDTGPSQLTSSTVWDAVESLKLESDEWRVLYMKKAQDNFVMTGAYHEARDAIDKKSSVLLVGASGDGKSTIIHYLAVNDMPEYLPIECSSPTEIKKYVDLVRNTETKLLFILDDVVGWAYLDRQKVGDWIRLRKFLEMYLQGPHKFLLATRTNVWEQGMIQLQDSQLFSNTVEVSSAKLTVEDKTNLLEKYLGSSDKLTPTEKIQIISNKPIAFTQCCRLVRKAIEVGKSGAEVVKIFEKPFTFLKSELEKMAHNDKVNHATLCLIMLCGGELKCRELTGTLSEVTPSVRERIDAVLEACGCPGQTIGNLLESVEQLCGTFLEKLHKTGDDSTRCEAHIYIFSHDSIREAVTMQYGGRHFRQCLQFLPPDLIVKISRPHSYEKEEHEFVVCVPDNKKELARVFTEAAIVGNWSLYDVFQNPFVQEENFQEVWVDYLKSCPDKQIAFIESKSWDGQCVLHLSGRSGGITLWRFLRGDLDVRCSCLTDFSSALCQAVEDGDKQTVINLMTSHKQTDYQIRRAFIVACELSKMDLTELLLQGINNDLTRDDVMVAGLRKACYCGRLEIVEYLLSKYYTPCRGYKCPCIDGLLQASAAGQLDIVLLLLSHGTDINSIDNLGYSALHAAAYSGHLRTVTILLQYGADINIRDSDKKTALHEAAYCGHLTVVQILLLHGADINIRDSGKKTALHEAAYCGHLRVVQILLIHGADINMTNSDNKTALHEAVCSGHLLVVETLLQHGADINVTDIWNRTALDDAKNKRCTAIVDMFARHRDDGKTSCIRKHQCSVFGNL